MHDMQIRASDLVELPIQHHCVGPDGFMFETVDHDINGDTARWRLLFDLDTGKMVSKASNEDIERAFSNWSI